MRTWRGLWVLGTLAVGLGCGSPDVPDGGDASDARADAIAPTDGPVAREDSAVDPRLATALRLREVALFQGVRVSLALNGAAVAPRNAPVVAERAAVVRAYVEPAAGWSPREVTGELVIEDDGAPARVLRATATPRAASTETDPASLFQFDVPAESVTPTARYAVRLLADDGVPTADGAASDARFPADGTRAPLGAASDRGGLNLVLVPLRYETDGSNRLPDTSPAQLARVSALLTALYPLAHARVTVRDPVPWARPTTFTGNVNFGDVNDMLIDLRTRDNAPDDAYYYAIVAPAASFDAYCGSSCVTGQSYVVDDAVDAGIRVGSGAWFSGENSVWTLAHEVGHQHGRSHAPCDVRAWDPGFPYAGAGLGVYGFDPRSRTFFAPDRATDFMGYCEPNWVSDYTWSALFARVRAVNGATSPQRVMRRPLPYLPLHIDAPDGAHWGRAVSMAALPQGAPRREVRFVSASGAPVGSARVVELTLSDSDERVLLVPAPPPGARAVLVPQRAAPIELPAAAR